jgi:hypothetical protein
MCSDLIEDEQFRHSTRGVTTIVCVGCELRGNDA